MKKLLLLCFVLWIGTSCIKVDKCEGILCFTPPPEFSIEIIDKTTGENLYTNGTLDSLNILLLNEEGSHENFDFIAENNINIIRLNEIGWKTGLHQYQLVVSDEITLDIKINMELMRENCCTYYKTISFQVLNYEFYQTDSLPIYVVKVD